MIDSVPDDICHSVVAKFILLKSNLPDEVNPINKILIVTTEIGSYTVSLDKIPNNVDEEGRAGDPNAGKIAHRTNV